LQEHTHWVAAVVVILALLERLAVQGAAVPGLAVRVRMERRTKGAAAVAALRAGAAAAAES